MLWPNALFGALFLILVIAAWRRRRQALRDRIESPPLELDQRAVQQIVQEGQLRTAEDEPLDLDEIEAEERRFWDEEEWDEAERF